MKAQLEPALTYCRGIILTAETDEEKEILQEMLTRRVRIVSFSKDTGTISITIAPTIGDLEGK